MNKFKITAIKAREILDCRWTPTVRVEVQVNNEIVGQADAPAGRSTGLNEASELRDNEERFNGLGVTKAVKNVNEIIAPALIGMDVTEQRKIDYKMIELDGTKNKENLGGNAIIAVSLACTRAAANAMGLPLYRYINPNAHVLPVPLLNLINGGKLTSNDLDFQEVCIFPVGAKSFKQAMEIGYAVNEELRTIIIDNYGKIAANVGDEGGFAPPIVKVREAMDHLVHAVELSGFADKIVYGFDSAASHFYDKDTKLYNLEGNKLTTNDMINYYKDLIRSYPIATIEDPLDENDVEGFIQVTKELGIQIVGDDFFCTNPALIKERSSLGGANALLWKFNQIGTVSEALDAAQIAFRNSMGIMVSERSGETEDPILADFTVSLNAGQIKTGAGVRSERTSKYNRLLQIEQELGSLAKYAGRDFKMAL
ncbi:MAG TPA: phosphopyruvate hydratase [Candidatus Atribacteria bacterium]|nr:phosphopyruvate hydratase [Candidatus Atribacteria bacterium]